MQECKLLIDVVVAKVTRMESEITALSMKNAHESSQEKECMEEKDVKERQATFVEKLNHECEVRGDLRKQVDELTNCFAAVKDWQPVVIEKQTVISESLDNTSGRISGLTDALQILKEWCSVIDEKLFGLVNEQTALSRRVEEYSRSWKPELKSIEDQQTTLLDMFNREVDVRESMDNRLDDLVEGLSKASDWQTNDLEKLKKSCANVQKGLEQRVASLVSGLEAATEWQKTAEGHLNALCMSIDRPIEELTNKLECSHELCRIERRQVEEAVDQLVLRVDELSLGIDCSNAATSRPQSASTLTVPPAVSPLD